MRYQRLRSLQRQRGQGMSEYILWVTIITIVCIAVLKYFGGKTKGSFQTSTNAAGGANERTSSGINLPGQ